MNLREALFVVWRRRSLVLVVALLGPLAVWMVGRPAGSSAQTYSASVSVTAPATGESSPIPQYAFIAIDTVSIATNVAQDLNQTFSGSGYTALDIQDLIEVSPLPDINIMTISVSGHPEEESARLLVERFGFHLIQYVASQRGTQINETEAALSAREQLLREQVSSLNADLRQARSRLTPAEIDAGVSPDPVKQAELDVALDSLGQVLAQLDDLELESEAGGGALLRATEPNVVADPMASTPLGLNARLLLATVLGAAFGVGLSFALHRFDTRLYNRKDAEAAFGLPVLAEIPRIGWLRRRNWQLIARSYPEAPASEAYRLLRSSLAQAARLQSARAGGSTHEGGTVVLVTSVSDQTGKSTTVANLAVAAVDARKRVLVVNADLRRPTLHSFFGVAPGPGLSDAVDEIEDEGIAAVDLDNYLAPTSVLGATLIRSGHPVPHPGERLALALPLIHRARREFDLVIIDTPAMLLGNDVNEMISSVDLVLLVAKAGHTTLEEAEWARETADRLQAPVCGVTLIGSNTELQRRGRLLSMVARLTRRVLVNRPLRSDAAGTPPEPERHGAAEPEPAAPSIPSGVAQFSAADSAATTLTFWPTGVNGAVTVPSPPEVPRSPAPPQAPVALAPGKEAEAQLAGAPSAPRTKPLAAESGELAGRTAPVTTSPTEPVVAKPETLPSSIEAEDFLAVLGLDAKRPLSPTPAGQEQTAVNGDGASTAPGTVDEESSAATTEDAAAVRTSLPEASWLSVVDRHLDLSLVDEDHVEPRSSRLDIRGDKSSLGGGSDS